MSLAERVLGKVSNSRGQLRSEASRGRERREKTQSSPVLTTELDVQLESNVRHVGIDSLVFFELGCREWKSEHLEEASRRVSGVDARKRRPKRKRTHRGGFLWIERFRKRNQPRLMRSYREQEKEVDERGGTGDGILKRAPYWGRGWRRGGSAFATRGTNIRVELTLIPS